MSEETELELYVDDDYAVSVIAPRDQALAEMRRYWAQYSADGKCTVYEITRTQINICDVLDVRDADQPAACTHPNVQRMAPWSSAGKCPDCEKYIDLSSGQ